MQCGAVNRHCKRLTHRARAFKVQKCSELYAVEFKCSLSVEYNALSFSALLPFRLEADYRRLDGKCKALECFSSVFDDYRLFHAEKVREGNRDETPRRFLRQKFEVSLNLFRRLMDTLR